MIEENLKNDELINELVNNGLTKKEAKKLIKKHKLKLEPWSFQFNGFFEPKQVEIKVTECSLMPDGSYKVSGQILKDKSMIKANELRIGNWVKEQDSRLVHLHDGFGIDHYAQFEPIPLTPEILEKCGFEICGEWFVKYKYPHQINVSIVHNKTTIGANEEYEIENLTSLHHLQNLYFALTGEDLQINL